MGLKQRARALMKEAGVPILPGSEDTVKSPEDAEELVASLTASGEIAAVVGQLTARSAEPVTFRGALAL